MPHHCPTSQSLLVEHKGAGAHLDVAKHTEYRSPSFFDTQGMQVYSLSLPKSLGVGQVIAELQQELAHLQQMQLLQWAEQDSGPMAYDLQIQELNASQVKPDVWPKLTAC